MDNLNKKNLLLRDGGLEKLNPVRLAEVGGGMVLDGNIPYCPLPLPHVPGVFHLGKNDGGPGPAPYNLAPNNGPDDSWGAGISKY